MLTLCMKESYAVNAIACLFCRACCTAAVRMRPQNDLTVELYDHGTKVTPSGVQALSRRPAQSRPVLDVYLRLRSDESSGHSDLEIFILKQCRWSRLAARGIAVQMV